MVTSDPSPVKLYHTPSDVCEVTQLPPGASEFVEPTVLPEIGTPQTSGSTLMQRSFTGVPPPAKTEELKRKVDMVSRGKSLFMKSISEHVQL